MSTYTSPAISLTGSLTRLSGHVENPAGNAAARGKSGVENAEVSAARGQVGDIGTAPIICFCHLGWDWVWQRPQQFLSRLAKHHPVLFVETYCSPTAKTFTRLRFPPTVPNLIVAEVHLPSEKWPDGDFIDLERRHAMQALIRDQLAGRFDHPVLWFYDPMAVTAFVGHLGERLVVYDCMDELSQFKGAPPELMEREQTLLRRAQVVFCGGRKMREKRLAFNPNCHFYGTGVDIQHFGKARSKALPLASEIARLDGPVLGYFGVIDERIDYDLLAKLADARGDWHIVMVGPTAKVDPKEFPQRPNLHWIGARSYEQLPALTKGFSACLMPFALNAATEYINPTKALEYMAAGKPVVSTALNEVKSNFASVARVANSHSEFVTWCVREAESPSQSRIQAGLRLAEENTWEAICAKMEAHIADAAAVREIPARLRAVAAASATLPSPSLPVQPGLAYV
ncbi:glycosyltransferase family 1 protein [Opitutaceae bacterium EW11]|nr:glycosyltransferase family 1 protein [Opitutaceae bacterium EW11]